MAINSFQDVENAFRELQAQLNSAFARQAHQISLALNKNDRDYKWVIEQLNAVKNGSESRAMQKGFDPSRRGRPNGDLVNSLLEIIQDGRRFSYNPASTEETTLVINSYDDAELREWLGNLVSMINDLLPAGTANQLILGDKTLTPKNTEDGEEFNAASSLFAEGDVANDAPDVLYGEFRNRGLRIDWENVVDLIFNEVFDRLNELGLLGGGGDGGFGFIESVELTIPTPAHGELLGNEVSIVNNDPRYYAGTIVWEPDDEIASGLKSYKAVFTIAPKFGFQFHPNTPLLVNGEPPSSAAIQSDWSMLITVDFAPTGNVPIDEIILTFDAPVDGENPNG
ncbi:MAG: hypothetical protein LBC64_08075 [Fibromonadaceae bacterium]|jgi:hypothetical protein|nr:hypothetical protein [Fibromonadaceae bacterium]